MKKYLIFILIIFITKLDYSQSSFKKLFSRNPYQTGVSILEDDSGNFIISGFSRDSHNNKNSYLLKIDKNGNFIKDTNLLNNDYALYIKYFNNYYYAIGTRYFFTDTFYVSIPPPQNSKFYFYKFDKNFNIINYKELNYKTDRWVAYFTFIIDSDTNIVITGAEREYNNGAPPNHDPFFYKISENGDSIKCVTFNSYQGECGDILEKKDNSGYYAFVQRFVNSYVISPSKILELNKNLDSISCRPIPDKVSQNFSVLYLNDTTFLISGNKIGDYKKLRAETVLINDSGNNYINYLEAGIDSFSNNAYPVNSLAKNNNFIYYVGELRLYLGYWVNGLYLLKLNNDLSIVWDKKIGGDSAMYAVTNIYATKDGGCVLLAARRDTISQAPNEADIYIIKIAADGTIQWENSIPVNTQINIYPNPGSNLINIQTDKAYNKFTMYDISGKQVLSQTGSKKTINTSNLPAGVYIYKLTCKNNKVIQTGKWVKQ